MTQTVTCYYALISPFTYLGQPRFMDIAKTAGATVVYKPFDIMQIFAHVGTLPPVKRHESIQAYRGKDLKRWSAKLGLPLNLPPKHAPVPSDLAGGMVLAAQDMGADVGPLVFSILSAVWAEDKNITDEDTLKVIADKHGFDGVDLVSKAASEQWQAAFQATTQEAKDAGVFGSPTFVIGEQMFWGQDRLDWVEAALNA